MFIACMQRLGIIFNYARLYGLDSNLSTVTIQYNPVLYEQCIMPFGGGNPTIAMEETIIDT